MNILNDNSNNLLNPIASSLPSNNALSSSPLNEQNVTRIPTTTTQAKEKRWVKR